MSGSGKSYASCHSQWNTTWATCERWRLDWREHGHFGTLYWKRKIWMANYRVVGVYTFEQRLWVLRVYVGHALACEPCWATLDNWIKDDCLVDALRNQWANITLKIDANIFAGNGWRWFWIQVSGTIWKGLQKWGIFSLPNPSAVPRPSGN